MSKLFAIDSMAILYRSYFAMIRNPLINSQGINTSGVFGYLNQIIKVIDSGELDYLAVTSDLPDPTFRHKSYPAYKATREKMPDDLVAQLPYLPRLIESLNLPYLTLSGYEADDIVGMLMKRCNEANIEGVMVTSDKDYMQLVTEKIVMLNHKSEIIDIQGVYEKFGCKPEQVIEVLGLMGDASDNIPGVRGVGEKTAIKLVQEYGSIRNVYEHLDEIKGKKLKENLINGKENAFLSWELVTIDRDVPLDIDFETLRVSKDVLHDNPEFHAILEELEFKSLIKRFKPEGKSVSSSNSKETQEEKYVSIHTIEALKELITKLQKSSVIALDIAASGKSVIDDHITHMALCVEDGISYYIFLDSLELKAHEEVVNSLLASLFETSIQFIGHDLKRTIQLLFHRGINFPKDIFDTIIAAHLLETGRNYNLDNLALSRLGKNKKFQLDSAGKTMQLSMLDEEDSQTKNYLCENAELIFQLQPLLEKQLIQTEMLSSFKEIEMPLVSVLARLEMAGVRFDMEQIVQVSEDFREQLKQLTGEIYGLADEEFNINSIIELQQILYEKLELHTKCNIRPKKIKIGNGMSTGEETLEKMKEFPLPRTVLKYRGINKLKNTYVDQLPSFVNSTTKNIHSFFKQTVAATGRLASDNPNLQNIPIRSEEGRRIRKLFIPSSPEHIMISADYSQIELRVVTHYSKDPTFLEAYQNGQDIHALTASAIFNIPLEQVDRDLRAKAKEVNFGLIYRMGPDRLSIVTQTTKKEAKRFIEKYFEKYSTIHALQESFLEKARKDGYSSTLMGRRRYLPEINSGGLGQRMAEGAAINTPIQGSAAEIIKLAMINIDRRLIKEKLKSKMILSIHDEIVFDVPEEEEETICQLVKDEMESVVKLEVPLIVEVGRGKNWLDAH